jgi:dolichol kinase
VNLKRKIFHATGIVIVAIYRETEIDRSLALGLLWSIAGLLALLDIARARYPALQERFLVAFSQILDKKDHKGLSGSTPYFAGCALALSLFGTDAACAGILALALGDPAAAIIGSSIPSPRRGNVSLAGSGACFVFASAACALFFELPQALAGGAAATALEALSGSKLDNLTIPVGTAAVLQWLY